MKPVGLDQPASSGVGLTRWCSCRQDNALGSLWNMVGFQTKLKHAEQVRIFRTIPGLEQAEFARLGGLHRNTFLNSPVLLDAELAAESRRRGCALPDRSPGSRAMWSRAAIGLLAGRFAAAERLGASVSLPPPTTALGALLNHITGGHLGERRRRGLAQLPADERQFRSVPSLSAPPPKVKAERGSKTLARKHALATRALADLERWLAGGASIAAE